MSRSGASNQWSELLLLPGAWLIRTEVLPRGYRELQGDREVRFTIALFCYTPTYSAGDHHGVHAGRKVGVGRDVADRVRMRLHVIEHGLVVQELRRRRNVFAVRLGAPVRLNGLERATQDGDRELLPDLRFGHLVDRGHGGAVLPRGPLGEEQVGDLSGAGGIELVVVVDDDDTTGGLRGRLEHHEDCYESRIHCPLPEVCAGAAGWPLRSGHSVAGRVAGSPIPGAVESHDRSAWLAGQCYFGLRVPVAQLVEQRTFNP